jgi:hypothetical protein
MLSMPQVVVVAVLQGVPVAQVLVVRVAFTEQRVLLALPTQVQAAAAVWGHRAQAQPTVERVLLVSSSLDTSVAVLAQVAPLARAQTQLWATRCTHSHQAVRFL